MAAGSTGMVGLPDSGPVGDTGGAVGPTLSGDSSEIGSGVRIVRTVTVTQILPYAPQFQLKVGVTTGDGPLYTCPVAGPFRVGDDFGAPRYAGGFHPHAGNDIFTGKDTPIVAPFDGVAVADPNTLGGNAVIVKGADGYVYNAHLSSYGHLGPVHAGDVIGYVGNTGDAQGTAYHDHFEWHPYQQPTDLWVGPYGDTVVDSGNPPAVDPFPYLRAACSRS